MQISVDKIGRNDPCFCGSGKKYKACHPEVHPDSYAARVYKLYNKVDKMIENHYCSCEFQPVCHRGCSECCKNTFSVGQIEYNIIQYELRKWDKDRLNSVIDKTERYWEELSVKYPEVAAELLTDRQGEDMNKYKIKDMFDKSDAMGIPCVFLDNNGECMIYNVRPFVCRAYGKTFQSLDQDFELCSKMKQGDIIKYGCDTTELTEEVLSLTTVKTGNNKGVTLRPYPLLYFMYEAFFKLKKELHIYSYEVKFTIPFDEYSSRLKDYFQV